jgi:hypothetical protein
MSSAFSGTEPLAKSKWQWRSPSVDRSALSGFDSASKAWSNNNMYRTSYHDMSDKVSFAVVSPHIYEAVMITECLETRASQVLCHSQVRRIHPRQERKLRAWQNLLQNHQEMLREGGGIPKFC